MSIPRNPVQSLMKFFVGDIIGRRVTPADYRGRHTKCASRLLKEMGYDYEAIEGALYSLRDRKYQHFGYESERELPRLPIEGMEVLYLWGEPPLIERWLAPPAMPPVYSHDFDKWVIRWGAIAIRRGEWDGIYIKQDPRQEEAWLRLVIGDARFKESVNRWQTQQRTSRQKRP